MKPSALVVVLCGCTHTVDVFVPVANVPARTPIVAAIAPGRVTELENGRLYANGVVAEGRKRVAKLAPSDVVVIEAGGGERFGRTVVTQARAGEPLKAIGAVIAIGGSLTSTIVGFGVGGSEENLGTMFYGVVAAALSLTVGVILWVAGANQPIHVENERVTFDPLHMRLVF